jgi:hypothetical protein
MSVIVHVKTEIKDASVAESAFRRHFKNTSVSGNKISCQVPADNYKRDIHVDLDSRSFQLSYDGDYTGIKEKVNQAYVLEEAIRAAENNGQHYEVNYNDETREFVLTIDQ